MQKIKSVTLNTSLLKQFSGIKKLKKITLKSGIIHFFLIKNKNKKQQKPESRSE